MNPPSGRVFAVFAALADKDVAGIVARLAAYVDRWWIAGLEDAGPRGQGVDALAASLAGTAAADASRATDVAAALVAASLLAQDTTVVTAARMLDVAAGRMVRPATVVVAGGRIG